MKYLLLMLQAIGMAFCAGPPARASDDHALIVIAHAPIARVDTATLQRLYKGRAIEVGGVPVVPVHLAAGQALRGRFFAEVLNDTEEKYTAYWTVRRHIGKGIPPLELKTVADVIQHVQRTPGALGYIGASDLKPGLNVVARLSAR
jgi:hypothetical protein